MIYDVNSVHLFIATGIVELKDERKYLTLKRPTESESTQLVPAYDFQTEWVDKFPYCIYCEVEAYEERRDKYKLRQCYYDILSDLYPVLPNSFKFNVVGESIDKNTNASFYLLKDAYGLLHRYYNTYGRELFKIGEEVELTAVSIASRPNRRGFLQFDDVRKEEISKVNFRRRAHRRELEPSNEFSLGREDEHKEFKTSIVYTPASINPRMDEQIKTIMKTIAGFMNQKGGQLYLGVDDSGRVSGIESDFPLLNSNQAPSWQYSENIDGYELKIRDSIKYFLGSTSLGNLVDFEFKKDDNDKTYCILTVQESKFPVFFEGVKLYQRMGNQTNLLKGIEICFFIMNRMKNTPQELPEVIDVTEPNYNTADQTSLEADSLEEIIEDGLRPHILPKVEKPLLTPWRYVRLYKGGKWSYGPKSCADDPDLVREIIIPKEHRKANVNRLMIIYKNGRVASVAVNNVKPQKADHIYSNGWQMNEEILDAFVVGDHDIIAYRSVTEDGEEWNKFHHAIAVSNQNKMGGMGNKVINEILGGTITDVAIVPTEYAYHLGSFLETDDRTSSTLGIPRSDESIRNSLPLLDALFAK